MSALRHPFTGALYERDAGRHGEGHARGPDGAVHQRRPLAGGRAARSRSPAVRMGGRQADEERAHAAADGNGSGKS